MWGVVAVAALLVLLAAPNASPSPTKHNPIRFTDPRGDVDFPGAPDIRDVTVFNSTKGMIQFDVAIANVPLDIPDENLIAIYLDTDRDASNGPYGGFEYTIQAVGLVDLFLARWDGTRYVPTSALVLNIWDDRGVMNIAIRSTRLGNTTRFRFWVATAMLPAAEDFVDVAPDRGAVNYALSTPHIARADALFSPLDPRAGRRFSVKGVHVELSSRELFQAASFRCRATLAGRAIRGSGRGGCTYALPRTARGKRLVITIRSTVATRPLTLRYTFRVR
jgi:hypothetical protein